MGGTVGDGKIPYCPSSVVALHLVPRGHNGRCFDFLTDRTIGIAPIAQPSPLVTVCGPHRLGPLNDRTPPRRRVNRCPDIEGHPISRQPDVDPMPLLRSPMSTVDATTRSVRSRRSLFNLPRKKIRDRVLVRRRLQLPPRWSLANSAKTTRLFVTTKLTEEILHATHGKDLHRVLRLGQEPAPRKKVVAASTSD